MAQSSPATGQVCLLGGPFDGETVPEGAVPAVGLVAFLATPDENGERVVLYRATRDPLVREFHGHMPLARFGNPSAVDPSVAEDAPPSQGALTDEHAADVGASASAAEFRGGAA